MIDQKQAMNILIAAGKRVVQWDQETNYETKAAIVAAITRIENDIKPNKDAS